MDKRPDISDLLKKELDIEVVDLEQYVNEQARLREVSEYFEIGGVPVYAQCKWESMGSC